MVIPDNVKIFRTWLEGAAWGISFSAIGHCLLQDALGLQGYINYVSTHWTVLSPWLWVLAAVVSLGMLVLTGFVLHHKSKQVNGLLGLARIVSVEQQATADQRRKWDAEQRTAKRN